MGSRTGNRARIRPNVANAARQARTALERALGAIVDFAVPDGCCLCSSRTGSPPTSSELERLPPASRCLAVPTVVPLLGPFSVVNHPICGPCLGRFEQSEGPARIGTCGAHPASGWVRTMAGEWFVHTETVVPGVDRAPTVPTGLEVRSPFRMNDASLELVRSIKFARRTSLAALAGAAMASALALPDDPGAVPLLVPVPMHPSALRRRGFNQAELLARTVAAAVGATTGQALRKTARTPPQSKTSRARRADNVRGAFRHSGTPVAGRRVCLVDDLVTTGATVAACAAVLLAAGARSVTVLCLAKTT